MHRNLTPGAQNKLLVRVLSGALLLAASSGLLAQNQTTDQSSYQGPGIVSPGIANVGKRSGEQVDLRYYFGVSGIVDSAILPYYLDPQKNLIHLPALYGFEVQGGLYGVHSWRHSQLGLDYVGSYTKYVNFDGFNSNNHSLTLGYTYEISRRLRLDLHESAGSLTYGTGAVANAASSDLDTSFTPGTHLFDARTYFLQSSVSASYIQSTRMSYTAGVTGYLQNLKSLGLSNGWGYTVNGGMMRRLSKTATLGANYSYSHFEFPGFSSKSDSHTFHGLYATGFARFWTVSVEAGATISQGSSIVSYALNPALAAVFGQSTIQGLANFKTIYPSGSIAIKRQFRHASLGADYFRGVNSGNGFYTTGRLDNAHASFSYTGLRRVNLGVDGGYYHLKSIGQQNLGNYSQYSAGAGVTYALGHDIHVSARYDYRDQGIDASGYLNTGYRATLGLMFSPGALPLSLW